MLAKWQEHDGHGGVSEPEHAWKIQNAPFFLIDGGGRSDQHEVQKTPLGETLRRSGNHPVGKPDMNADRKSHGSIIPSNQANKPGTEPGEESAEERDPAKRNADQPGLPRAPQRKRGRSLGLAGVRETARRQPELQFTSLMHHVSEDLLREAFFELKKTAAVGIDEVSWNDYEQGHEERLAELHGRLHRGAYRASPSKRIYIPKPDGRQRPIGIASLEDKIVQKAIVWVLQCIYEQDFVGFSYGFRPGRSQHQALGALTVALKGKQGELGIGCRCRRLL